MDRILSMKRSAPYAAHAEQGEGTKDPSVPKKAKEVHPDEADIEQGLTADVEHLRLDDADSNAERSRDPRLNLRPFSDKSSDTELTPGSHTILASEVEMFADRRERERSRLIFMERSPEWNEANGPVVGIDIWDARAYAERFANLREEILRRHYCKEIYPVKAFEGEVSDHDVTRTGCGPLILFSNPLASDEPPKKEVADENSSRQIQEEWQERDLEPACVFSAANYEPQAYVMDAAQENPSKKDLEELKEIEFETPFLFTAANEWGTVGFRSRLIMTPENSSHSLGSKKDQTMLAQGRPKITREDTPYKIRKTWRSRIGASDKLFQRKTSESDFLGSPGTPVSQSLDNLWTAESPGRTPEKAQAKCVKILGNVRGSQKAHKRARKLARQHSAAERASLTAQLQTIARGCSISSCSSPVGESWKSVKIFLSNLFCCKCNISDCEGPLASPRETAGTEVKTSPYVRRETPDFGSKFAIQGPVSLPAFPDVTKRQRSSKREQRSASCGWELEKAMEIRMLQKKH